MSLSCCANRPGKTAIKIPGLNLRRASSKDGSDVPPLLMATAEDEESMWALAEHGHKEKLAALLDLESSKRNSSVGPGSPISRNSGSSRNSGRDEDQEELAVDQACPETGTTPLIAASKAGSCGCISLLIDNGANINKANHKGWTPLMAAARYGGRNAVRILIMHKSDATATLGPAGLTAVDLALQAREEAKDDKERAFSPRIQQMYDEAGGREVMMARDAAYLLLESEEKANDKEEDAATKAVLEQAAAQLQMAVERVKRVVRGSVVPEHIVPNTKDLSAKAPPSRKAGDKLTSPRGHDAASLMSPRGQ